MLHSSLISAVTHLCGFLSSNEVHLFKWADFYFSSTLQLSPCLDVLLEPVTSKSSKQKLELGLHEALVNAVQHGNSSDPYKLLRVRRILTPNWFIWQIQDQGNGVPLGERIGLLPSEIDAESGRGLFMIYQCFDDVRWSRRGNRIQLACKRNSLINDLGNQDLLSRQ